MRTKTAPRPQHVPTSAVGGHHVGRARRPRTMALGVGLLAGALFAPGAVQSANSVTKTTKAAAKSSSKSSKSSSKSSKTATSRALLKPNATGINPAVPFSATPPSEDPNLPSAADASSAWTALAPGGGRVLVMAFIGSDARPGERVERGRADAIHVFSYNVDRRKGVLFAFPRDTLVRIPGRSKTEKINAALSTGGPETMIATLNQITGLKIQRYMITGFEGIRTMVDQMQGITVNVDPAISDTASGAFFQKGWFKMNGDAALSYARARKSLKLGDLDRVFNQYRLMFYSGMKLRTETSTIADLVTWINVAKQNTVSNIAPTEWMYFAQIARDFDPERQLDFVRVPGKLKGENYEIGAEAQAFFADIRADGFRGK
jgi:LCP family protein required for cell wall assembly